MTILAAPPLVAVPQARAPHDTGPAPLRADSSAAAAAASARVPTTGRFRWRPVPVPPLPEAAPDSLAGRRVLVIGGDAGERERLAADLAARGAVTHTREAPEPAGDGSRWPRLDLPPLDVVVDLGLPEDAPVVPGAWWAALAHTFAVLRRLHPSWSVRDEVGGTCYLAVTRMGGLMARGDGPVPQPLGGLWAGLAKGLPRELPSTAVRVVDVDRAAAAGLGRLVAAELGDPGVFEVGYHHGVRHLLRAFAEPVTEQVAQPVTEPVTEPVTQPAGLAREPRRPLGPGATVAMSGGGRGIGFALALRLARTHGCRVLVSGRGPVPDDTDPVIAMDAAAFAAHRRQALIRAAAEGSVARARRQLAAAAQRRELAANLARARAEGLAVEYLTADVTVPEQARALLAAAGPDLALVVHDAGVDVPARLPEKDLAQVRRTVAVKADGFVTLWQAARELGVRPAWSLAGSMTGRWGGMVGQLEYGAANEALATLAGWASAQPGAGPVTTVAWPTWQQLGGMISNYEATLAYMAAMPVEEGLDHWEAEVLGGGSGEVGFLGEVGAALTPTVLRGYHQPAQLPQQPQLSRAHLLLGTPRRYRPDVRLVTGVRLDPDRWPVTRDVLRAGVPSVPVALLLELMRGTAAWLSGGWGSRPLTGIRDLVVDLDALDLAAAAELEVEAEVSGPAADGQLVRVRVGRTERATPVAGATLSFSERERPIPQPPVRGERLVPDVRTPVPLRRHWLGTVLPVPGWALDPATGSWWADVPAISPASLTAFEPALDPMLPVAALETVVRALVLGRGPHPGGPGSLLQVPWTDVDLGDRVAGSSVCRDADGRWTCLDGQARPVLRLHRPRLVQPAHHSLQESA